MKKTVQRKRGRPPTPKSERRGHIVNIRFTDDELKRLDQTKQPSRAAAVRSLMGFEA